MTLSKYLSKTQNRGYSKGQKTRWKRFFIGMLIYAVIFLGAAACGLKYLWSYLEAYESSRPKNTVEAYMNSLTADHIAELGMEVFDQIDKNLQSEEECRNVICEAIADGLSYAKSSKESSDTQQVYVLRSGSQVVGRFTIESGASDENGFSGWTVIKESFDFSFLIGKQESITVPSGYSVSANGHLLDSGYITEDNVPFEEIKDYYEDYDMPYQVTYAAGPILGKIELTVADSEGNQIIVDENTDWSSLYDNCTEERIQELDAFTKVFVERYVAFTGSNKNTRYGTYNRLMEYVVADSDLAIRLSAAIEGLQFGQSQGDQVVSIATHHRMDLGDDKYLCDITYEVDTTGKQGVVRTETNAKLIIAQTEYGLKLESMNIY